MKILIVEDEVRLAEAITHIIKEAGYETETVHDGEDALALSLGVDFDLIVLDVMLPGMSGFDIVRQMRKEGVDTPVLMLTAKSEIEDKVDGLEHGADDYMTKPFDSKELIARIRALLRRSGNIVDDSMYFSDLTLDISSHELSCGDKSIHLGLKEFDILKILMNNPNQITSKEDLIIKIWGYDSEAEDNNVEAFISFLRKKFFHLESQVGIKTIRKVGYQLEEQ